MKVYGINPAARDLYRAMREKNIRREAARIAFVGLIRGGIIGGQTTPERVRGCVCAAGHEWHHPLTGHCGGCGCFTCSAER